MGTHGGSIESLEFAINALPHRGLDWAEFGVYTGTTARYMLKRLPVDCNLYLFDSFKGLPRDWGNLKKGDFALEDNNKPVFPDGRVNLIEGMFEDTVNVFGKWYTSPLGLVHMDADLYESTLQALNGIVRSLIHGTIIVFDEYFDEAKDGTPLMLQDEGHAFTKFMEGIGLDFIYLAKINPCQAVVMITE